MSPIVEGAGVPLSVTERGDGPPVLAIHDLGAPPPALDVPARVIAYDRRGYGASGAPEPYVATTVHEQAEDAAAVLRATTVGPAVVAGDGFGALIALDLASRHAGLVAALALRDPPLYAFVPEAAEALAAERKRLEAAPPLQGHLADFAGITSWPVTRGTLRAIAQPAALVISPDAQPHTAKAAIALAALLPASRPAADLESAVRELLGGWAS